MCRKNVQIVCTETGCILWQRVQSRPEIFFRGGNYDRNTEKTASADYDIRSFRDLFTGYPHVWSIYQPYVMEQAGWSQGQASMCFYLALSTFVFGNIVGGRMQNRFKEKTIVWIGGGDLCSRNPGIRISDRSHTASYVSLLWSDAGIWSGNDLYGDPGNSTKMVSDRTGFASGVVVTANGLLWIFFLAPLSRKLLEAEGVQKTLLIVGVAITISWILCGIFFQAPDKSLVNAGGSAEKSGTPEMKQYTSGEMMRTKIFIFFLRPCSLD